MPALSNRKAHGQSRLMPAVFEFSHVVADDELDAVINHVNNLAYLIVENSGDLDQALTFAQRAKQKMPNQAGFIDTIGWIYYRKGNYGAAIGYLKTAVDKEPTPMREFHLGMSYLKSGQKDLGEKMLQAALVKDPNLAKTEEEW